MAKKRTVPIKYTSREFDSIKSDLVDYAKRYYPETFRDFNEASFGSLMLDTVAYVGDILSFYLDYQVNESFMDTAIEFPNVVKHAKQLGYKFNTNPSSSGLLTFYIKVPANSSGTGPDENYMPVLRRGSTLSSLNGNLYTLVENVNFANPTNEIVVAAANANSVPTFFAIKAFGEAISGELLLTTVAVGPFKRFLKLEIPGSNIAEIVSVVDLEGHEYFEVDYLSQDTIYSAVINRGSDRYTTPYLMHAKSVLRRFVVEREANKYYLQFGQGSESELTNKTIADPASIVFKTHGRDYVSDVVFDPTNLVRNDKLGVAPSNTTLTIRYRVNNASNVNSTAGIINNVNSANFEFTNSTSLDPSVSTTVRTSLEVTNERSFVGDVSTPSAEEVKRRAIDNFATQSRAVTKHDYVNFVYSMPPKFGAVKRCNIIRDTNSIKRNLNLYVISENSDGTLIETNNTIKRNIKTWLNRSKMINDTIDIMDAKIVNIGIEFSLLSDMSVNKFDVLTEAVDAVKEEFGQQMDIGEPIYITNIFNILKNIESVFDVVSVNITKKTGIDYASTGLELKNYYSPDRRYLYAPENIIYELKYPDTDIRGIIR